MWTIVLGIVIATVSWLPYEIYSENHPTAIAFDFGVLSMLGVFIGGVVAVVGLVRSFIRTVRDASRT